MPGHAVRRRIMRGFDDEATGDADSGTVVVRITSPGKPSGQPRGSRGNPRSAKIARPRPPVQVPLRSNR